MPSAACLRTDAPLQSRAWFRLRVPCLHHSPVVRHASPTEVEALVRSVPMIVHVDLLPPDVLCATSGPSTHDLAARPARPPTSESTIPAIDRRSGSPRSRAARSSLTGCVLSSITERGSGSLEPFGGNASHSKRSSRQSESERAASGPEQVCNAGSLRGGAGTRPEERACIDPDLLAGEVPRFIRQQEQRQVGDVDRFDVRNRHGLKHRERG